MVLELDREFSRIATGQVDGVDASVCWVDHLTKFPNSRRNNSRTLVLGLPRFNPQFENPCLVIIGNREGQLEVYSGYISV